ncbi:MAG: peptidoglycan DD-metalloendopeptidase family protein [Oscillospiraceae bacterium]|jgi:murein DD-endopeptidase MepM/ murein hydrolase activator NlpD|nr:peptidoglycan DD-metalloendopeptidase family protein [Oscillospiraceae bacterium]
MRNKKFVRLVAVILALMMVISVIIAGLSSLRAGAVSQAQIDALKAVKKELNDKKRAVQSEINSLRYDQLSATAKKEVLDDRISLTEQEIANINEQIELYVDLIGDKEREVAQAQRREDAQLELYKRRIRDMEENGAVSYIAVIFEAASFSDLLARIDFVSDIMRADEAAYKDLVEARLETIAAKEALEATQAEQEAERVELLSKEDELIEQVEESIALIVEIEADLDARTALWAQIDAETDKLQEEINKKTEELRAQAASRPGSVVNGSGSLQWPGTSNVVTRTFGTMEHPIYGDLRPHYGIDLRAAYGSNIYAADSGTVITSTYSSSYGNYVVISHGGTGMTTLYAHMSARNVKVGDSVTKGAVVGYAGSTGASTATHLHFEVSVNGSRVNPLNYFSSGYVLKDGA